MIRAYPRRRPAPIAPAIDRDRVARRLTGCSRIAAFAIAGLGFGLGLCLLCDAWTGQSVLPLMFAL